jgi:hypothetical protein
MPQRLVEVAARMGRHSSRISTGRDLLSNEDGRSRWARLLKATYRALIQHCGGDDVISDVQRMACRRIGALEAELVHIEDRLARLRRSRKEPPATLLSTYASLTAQQHRLSKELGWDRHAKPRDIAPQSPHDYPRLDEPHNLPAATRGRNRSAAEALALPAKERATDSRRWMLSCSCSNSKKRLASKPAKPKVRCCSAGRMPIREPY